MLQTTSDPSLRSRGIIIENINTYKGIVQIMPMTKPKRRKCHGQPDLVVLTA
jgi:hypothetical protein